MSLNVPDLLPVNHRGRRDAVRERLDEAEVDALYVTALVNVRWLTGFTGSSGYVLVAADPDADLFVTDGRYDEQAATQVPDLDREITRGVPTELIVERAADAGVGPVGFEANQLAWSTGQELRSLAEEHDLEARPAPQIVERLRAVKDEHELAALRAACAITAVAFDDLLDHLQPGRTEREVAIHLERTMVDLGAEERAFESIVASGPNSAIPHHRPTERTLRRGDLVKLDFGARYAGYHADMTRTVALGEPDDELREVHDLVREAQRTGVEAATDGTSTGDLDAACRGPIEEAGYGEQFVHGTGHGVGLEIHERPTVMRDATGSLATDMTVTVEPGVYLPGRGGVRIEDTVAIRADGPAEILTTPTRELLIL